MKIFMQIYFDIFRSSNESWHNNLWQRFVTGAFEKEPHHYFHPVGDPEASISIVIRSLR